MPWSLRNLPNVAKNWTEAEQRKCVTAANATLRNGGSDSEAIFACIAAAGKGNSGRYGMGNKMTGVEIFAVGKWNGLEFTTEDLRSIASNFERLSAVHRVPLKLGHNTEQPLTDGQPALGWVTRVYVQGGKLLADFEDVPDVMVKAVEAGLYRQVSIELDFGASHKGTVYDMVLSGVALLGADLPAVNTLKDLEHYLPGKQQLHARRHEVFTFTKCNDEDSDMNIEEELKQVKDQLATFAKNQQVLEDKASKLAEDNAALKNENAVLKKEKEEREQFARKEKLDAARKSVTEKLDAAVKDERITPAQREAFARVLGVDDDERVLNVKDEDIVALVGEPKNEFRRTRDDAARSKARSEDDSSLRADERLDKRARTFARENKVDYSTAVMEVLEADPDLAKEYKDLPAELDSKAG